MKDPINRSAARNTVAPVDVVIPLYNAAPFVERTLHSVLAQTRPPKRIIVVDDGSTDGSPDVVRRLAGKYNGPVRIELLEQPNAGPNTARNTGLQAGSSPFVAFLDADDLWAPSKLEEQLSVFSHDPSEDLLLVYCRAHWIDTHDRPKHGTPLNEGEALRGQVFDRLLPRNRIWGGSSAVLIRRKAFDLAGPFDVGLRAAEDFDMWLRIAQVGRVDLADADLVGIRDHATNTSKNSPYMLDGLLEFYLKWYDTAKDRPVVMKEWGHLIALFALRSGNASKAQRTVVHKLSKVQRQHFFQRTGGSLALYMALKRLRAQLDRIRPASPTRLREIARDVYRCLTYSPFARIREELALRRVERTWKGRQIFLFPYVHTGGAEQVHADIVAAVADQHPLIIVSGFSTDRAFASSFAKHGTLLELPRSLNHPFHRKNTRERLARLINAQHAPVVFGALSNTFFELLHDLEPKVCTYYLQHAFLHQPEGNVQHKAWLHHVPRVDGYIFISSRSKEEFARFLFANNIPRAATDKLMLISNAVHRFGEVRDHERLGLLFVGRDSKEKRLPQFLALADRLERERPGIFRFSVVGSGPVQGHPQVHFHGVINDAERMAALYAGHDVLVLTSDREGFPLVIMEAMAQGLAVVSTPVGDVPFRLGADEAVIASGIDAGIVLKEFTETVLALDADRSHLRNMKTAALAKARKEFDPQRFAEHYRALLIRP
jgi:glycosyltransferase involved in cell wall biosynthesis